MESAIWLLVAHVNSLFMSYFSVLYFYCDKYIIFTNRAFYVYPHDLFKLRFCLMLMYQNRF